MNWGTKVVIVMVLFVAGIGYMISVCVTKSDMQLVTPDYYEQEIVYQGTIDKINNYNLLKEKPNVSIDETNNSLIIDFSGLENYQAIEGNIHFFRPSDSKLDFNSEIELTDEGFQSVENNRMKEGKWIVKLDWISGNKGYYAENTIYVP